MNFEELINEGEEDYQDEEERAGGLNEIAEEEED
jgi:hypothetical protein